MGKDTAYNKKKVGGFFGKLKEVAAGLNENRAIGQKGAEKAEENMERVKNPEDEAEKKKKRRAVLIQIYGNDNDQEDE